MTQKKGIVKMEAPRSSEYSAGLRAGVPKGAGNIFLLTTASRTALGPTQPPIQWVPGFLSLGVKRRRREADYSPPSRAEVKNAWNYTSTPQYTFMAWCSVTKSTGATLLLPYNILTEFGIPMKLAWLIKACLKSASMHFLFRMVWNMEKSFRQCL
jgi:hypothetical protein